MVANTPHPDVIAPPHGLCWKRSDRRRTAVQPLAHQELVVLLGLSGRAEYLIDGEVVELRAGTLLWALAGQMHMLLSDAPEFDMWVVLISGDILTPELRAAGDMPPLSLREAGGPVRARAISRAGAEELDAISTAQRGMQSPEARAVGLRWWLARAWFHWRAAPEGQGRAVHPAVDRAARMWREDPARSLRDVAGEAGLSAGRLGRLFRQEIGKSVVAYRTDQKLARVEAICREVPRATLMTAALDAGFGSYAQFFRAYRDRFGVAPSKQRP